MWKASTETAHYQVCVLLHATAQDTFVVHVGELKAEWLSINMYLLTKPLINKSRRVHREENSSYGTEL